MLFLRWTEKWIGGEWSKKKLSDPEMEWRSFLIPQPVLHHFSADNVIAIPSQAITTGPYFHLCLPVFPSLSYFYSYFLLYQTTSTDLSDTSSIHPIHPAHIGETRVDRYFRFGQSKRWYINRRRSLSNISVYREFVK